MSYLEQLRERVLRHVPTNTLPVAAPPCHHQLAPANDDAPLHPITSPWPMGVDLHLTRQAAQLSGLIALGATWRQQPDGSLDLWRTGSGEYLGIGAWWMERMRAARLLPEGL
jgi:hypothetical protein